ncbi:hypothetical protein Bbelb_066200 [Branchiostoma belcheri]|nr:hypothetical protein Bbelb_066200 [Branchiostoma belcheri]
MSLLVDDLDDFRVDCELCRHWGLSRRTGAKQNCAGGVEERRGRSRFFAGAKQNGAGAKQNGGGEEEGKSVPFCHIFTSPAVWASIMLLAASYIWEETLLPLYFQQSFGIQVELVSFGSAAAGMAVNLSWVESVEWVVEKDRVLPVRLRTIFYANPFDIAPRYASVLTGTSRVICRAVGLTFPLLVAALTENKTRQEWSRVVLIKSGFFAATAVVFGVFGSGEEQPWAVQLQQQRSTQLFILG